MQSRTKLRGLLAARHRAVPVAGIAGGAVAALPEPLPHAVSRSRCRVREDGCGAEHSPFFY